MTEDERRLSDDTERATDCFRSETPSVARPHSMHVDGASGAVIRPVATKDTVFFQRAVFLNALPIAEADDADQLADAVAAVATKAGFPEPERYRTPTAAAILSVLDTLAHEVECGGPVPLLHIDAHGDSKQGIVRLSSSTPECNASMALGWKQLSIALGRLNHACGNRMMVIVGTCDGFELNGQIDLGRPAPYSVGIAPLDAVFVPELAYVIPSFYREMMLSNDPVAALRAFAPYLQIFSIDEFIRDVLVRMHGSQASRSGERRRGGPCQDYNLGGTRHDIEARVRCGLPVTARDIDTLCSTTMCGRPLPFVVDELLVGRRAGKRAAR